MSDKKYKSADQQLRELELMHSGKYGHKIVTSRKVYKRAKVKKESKQEIDSYDEYKDTSDL